MDQKLGAHAADIHGSLKMLLILAGILGLGSRVKGLGFRANLWNLIHNLTHSRIKESSLWQIQLPILLVTRIIYVGGCQN